jgi:hypothetical protein
MNTFLALSLGLGLATVAAEERPHLLLVVGAPGTPEYGEMFQNWAGQWQQAAAKGSVTCQRLGSDEGKGETDREVLRKYLAKEASKNKEPLWIVLIGHGTYDGRAARFNLRGPDISAQELAGWLEPVKRPVVLINCASSSGPFINAISGNNRVVVTATRSGHELNFARFGQYLAEAIADPSADLDKDKQVSLLEAYLMASARTAEFYRSKARLATEHSLLDDNGDQLGTPPDWFRGVRAIRRARDGAAVDGRRAHQLHLIPNESERSLPAEVRRRRDELELSLANLRDRKDQMEEDAYYAEVEKLMIELAHLYRDLKPSKSK